MSTESRRLLLAFAVIAAFAHFFTIISDGGRCPWAMRRSWPHGSGPGKTPCAPRTAWQAVSSARVLETGELVWFDPNMPGAMLYLIVGVRKTPKRFLVFLLAE